MFKWNQSEPATGYACCSTTVLAAFISSFEMPRTSRISSWDLQMVPLEMKTRIWGISNACANSTLHIRFLLALLAHSNVSPVLPASLPKMCCAEDELDVDEVSWSWGLKQPSESVLKSLELFYAVVGESFWNAFVDYFHGTFKASRLFRYKFGVKCFSLGSPIFFCIRCRMDTWIM